MHGRTTSLIVAAAAAMVGASLGGCIVHNHPASAEPKPPSPQVVHQATPAATQKAARPAAPEPAPAPAKPKAAAPSPPAVPSARTYTIKPGDNLWNISKEVYGDGTKYPRIIEANPGLNPDNMKPGTKIVIP